MTCGQERTYKKRYEIAGVSLEIQWPKENGSRMWETFDAFEIFEDRNGESVAMEISVCEKKQLFLECYGIGYHAKTRQFPHVFWSSACPGVRMSAAEDYGRVVIEMETGGQTGPNADGRRTEAVMEMLLVGVYSHLARERGILAHASLVELHGQGVMFVGRSGIGKTTQAELWSRYLGARVLNGDKVLLTPREKGYLAWGSPWKGSSPYAVNESAPLKAAVILEQGEENRMERLTSPGCLERFLPHVFYPVWDEAASAGMMEGLDILMSYLPVYRLSCRPDEEAARLAYETIFGAKEP